MARKSRIRFFLLFDKKLFSLYFRCRSRGGRALFPLVNVFTAMIKGQAVFVAEVLVAVFAVEWEIQPLAAESAGLIQGVFFPVKKTGKKCPDPADDSHG